MREVHRVVCMSCILRLRPRVLLHPPPSLPPSSWPVGLCWNDRVNMYVLVRVHWACHLEQQALPILRGPCGEYGEGGSVLSVTYVFRGHASFFFCRFRRMRRRVLLCGRVDQRDGSNLPPGALQRGRCGRVPHVCRGSIRWSYGVEHLNLLG